MKLYIAQINPILGDFDHNVKVIISEIEQAKQQMCDLVIFPELALSGYSPEDLLLEKSFIENQEKALQQVVNASTGISVIVGCFRETQQILGKPLANSCCVITDAKIIGFQDKCLLPTYDVFDEWRYFEPAISEKEWLIADKRIGICICEDMWYAYEGILHNRYQDDPLKHFIDKPIDLLINLSASPYSIGKINTRLQVAANVAKRVSCPVALVNQAGGQDGILFDGSSFVVTPEGSLLAKAKTFAVDAVVFDTEQQKECEPFAFEPGKELFSALVVGVRDYFHKQGFKKGCLGISGGIDSAVVAAIAVEALGKEHVVGLFLPSRFTSETSREGATQVAKNLGIKLEEYSIEPALQLLIQNLGLTGESEAFTVVEENLQSRIRGVMLMALSNKEKCLVLSTGNKSEIAMGYTTLYGDSVGAVGVLGDLLKRQVLEVASYINRDKVIIPEQVLKRAPSAELRFNQKDSDTLPEYPILDKIVEEYIVKHKSAQEIAKEQGLDHSFVQEVCNTIHKNEYKRRQLPLALRVSDKAFNIGRRVPIVSKA